MSNHPYILNLGLLAQSNHFCRGLPIELEYTQKLAPHTVLRFGVKVAVVRYLNFSKNAKNGFNMQFEFILNVFCQEIDKLLHTSVQFYTETMTSSLSNCLIWQVCY